MEAAPAITTSTCGFFSRKERVLDADNVMRLCAAEGIESDIVPALLDAETPETVAQGLPGSG